MGDVGDADASSGHEEVVNVAGVKAAVRDDEGLLPFAGVVGFGDEFFTREVFGVLWVGAM